jgi:hypothetical protein
MGLAIEKVPASLAPSRALLLYCRPSGDFAAQDHQVAALRRELIGQVDVELQSPPEAARRLRTWISSSQPTLLVLRGAEIVSIAIGSLPRRELEHLVRHAIL